ncbi:VanZ family protein [Kitasatospora sp. NPDC048365]|uniref:VanZ family protein n=1 Tax=Kitasatospora sp. NPDC048365 TaxID=3364050 RepID=UPI0037108D04
MGRTPRQAVTVATDLTVRSARRRPAPGGRKKAATATAPAAAPKTATGRATPDRRPITPRGVLTVAARSLARVVALLAFALCAAVVIRLTLTPSAASMRIAHTNLSPGSSIRLYLDRPSVRAALFQVGGNALVGAPFGVLLPVVSRRLRGPVRTTLAAALAVTLLETLQHFFVPGRSFDVDDIILASAGALVAYLLLGLAVSRRIHPRRPRRSAATER